MPVLTRLQFKRQQELHVTGILVDCYSNTSSREISNDSRHYVNNNCGGIDINSCKHSKVNQITHKLKRHSAVLNTYNPDNDNNSHSKRRKMVNSTRKRARITTVQKIERKTSNGVGGDNFTTSAVTETPTSHVPLRSLQNQLQHKQQQHNYQPQKQHQHQQQQQQYHQSTLFYLPTQIIPMSASSSSSQSIPRSSPTSTSTSSSSSSLPPPPQQPTSSSNSSINNSTSFTKEGLNNDKYGECKKDKTNKTTTNSTTTTTTTTTTIKKISLKIPLMKKSFKIVLNNNKLNDLFSNNNNNNHDAFKSYISEVLASSIPPETSCSKTTKTSSNNAAANHLNDEERFERQMNENYRGRSFTYSTDSDYIVPSTSSTPSSSTSSSSLCKNFENLNKSSTTLSNPSLTPTRYAPYDTQCRYRTKSFNSSKPTIDNFEMTSSSITPTCQIEDSKICSGDKLKSIHDSSDLSMTASSVKFEESKAVNVAEPSSATEIKSIEITETLPQKTDGDESSFLTTSKNDRLLGKFNLLDVSTPSTSKNTPPTTSILEEIEDDDDDLICNNKKYFYFNYFHYQADLERNNANNNGKDNLNVENNNDDNNNNSNNNNENEHRGEGAVVEVGAEDNEMGDVDEMIEEDEDDEEYESESDIDSGIDEEFAE
jgi:trimeric autotransporter adhesin